MISLVKQKRIYAFFIIALFLVTFAFGLYSFITGVISFGELEDVWDGVSVATQFESGNGTFENPYIIKTPEEFVYFKALIEGDSFQAYQDKYYALDDDLNFGDNSFSSIGVITATEEGNNQEKIFKGHLDGRGHSIYNL